MPPSDPELYLRLLGERSIVHRGDAQRRAYNSVLQEVARALVAVGAVEPELAEAVVESYGRAEALRNGRGGWYQQFAHSRSAGASGTSPPPAARRTVRCNVTIMQPQREVHVRRITLADSGVRVAITIRPPGPPATPPSRRMRRGGPAAWQHAPQATLTDDRGTTTTAGFGGGGSDQEWRGHLSSDTPLALDTEWIELDGTRIELHDDPGDYTVRIEPVGEPDPVRRYLWHWVAARDFRHADANQLGALVAALTATGRLRADDPVIELLEAASNLNQRWGNQPPSPGALDGAPAEWRSLAAPRPRARRAGGSITVGAVTPPFDGVTVAVDEVDCEDGGFSVEVEVSPGIRHRGPFNTGIDQRSVAWWAADDLGHHYLGSIGQWSGGDEGGTGTIEFSPPLAAKATRLTLMPTGPNERALIEFALRWVK